MCLGSLLVTSTSCKFGVPSIVLAFLLSSPAARADKMDVLLQRAADHELNAEWDKACSLYEEVLRTDRTLHNVKARYQQCLRRYWQARRHRDFSYRKEVLSINYGEALKLYSVMRDTPSVVEVRAMFQPHDSSAAASSSRSGSGSDAAATPLSVGVSTT